MKKFAFILICSVSFVFSNNAFANQITPESGIAVAELFAKKGKVTKEQYDSFWKRIGVKTNKEKKQVIAFMKDNFMLVQGYQKELWGCAAEAWKIKRQPRCPQFKDQQMLLTANFRKIGQEQALEELTKSSKEILTAAATHGSYKLGDGKEIQLSQEIILATKENLDNIFSRFQQVLTLEYQL